MNQKKSMQYIWPPTKNLFLTDAVEHGYNFILTQDI